MKTLIHTLFFLLLLTQICFGQWYPQNSGTTQHLNKVQFVDANTGWAVGDSGLILHTSNGGVDWVQQASGTNLNLLGVCFTSNNTGWAVGGSGEYWIQDDTAIILKTTNGGMSWSKQLFIKCKFYDVCFTSENIGYVVGYGPDTIGQYRNALLLSTTNAGNTWTYQYDESEINNTSVDFIDANTGWLVRRVWCVGSGGCQFDLYKTINGGSNWQIIDSIVCNDLHRIKALDSNYIIAVGKIGNRGPRGLIFKTTDGGIEWSVQTPIGENSDFKDLNISSENVTTVVGYKSFTGGIILRSTDSAITWEVQEFSSVTRLNGITFIDDYIGWVVGDSGTILHTTNGGVTFIDNESTQPTEFLLSQNFPNPFNPITKISWQSPVGSHQTIKVFDVLGNEIANLVDEYKPAGRYEVDFQSAVGSRQLASGIYFYRIQTGEYVETKKMVLIR